MLFDDVLREIGEFGPYQRVIYILLGFFALPTGWQNMGISFFGANMDHWCSVPELSGLSHTRQKHIAVPHQDSEGGFLGNLGEHHHPAAEREGDSYDQCNMFDIDYTNFSREDFLAWNRSVMTPDGTAIKACPSGWVYDQSIFVSTVVSQFNLVCSRGHLVSLIQTIYMCGFLLGGVVFGQMSDRLGRAKTLLVSIAIEVVFAVAVIFVPNYAGYVVLRFFVAVGAAGAYLTMFVICMEIIGPRYRMVTGILIQVWFAIGLLTLPLFSYAVRDHKKLQLICAVAPVVLLLAAPLIPESPRWLVSENRDEQAEKLLEKIALINGTRVPHPLNLQDNRVENFGDQAKPTMTDLFRTPNLRKITCNMCFQWFVVSMVYYGLSLGVNMLGGSLFLNSFISGVIEIPAYVIVAAILDKTGRRWPQFASLVVGGTACLVCVAFIGKPHLRVAMTVLLMVGKFFLAGSFAIIFVYSAELFPTVVRQVGVGTSSMCARIGGLIQPQLNRMNTVWPPGPFVIYGALSVIAGLSALFLPETSGQKLPESIEEGEEFGKNSRFTQGCCHSKVDNVTPTTVDGEKPL